jgi:hypothetical protein
MFSLKCRNVKTSHLPSLSALLELTALGNALPIAYFARRWSLSAKDAGGGCVLRWGSQSSRRLGIDIDLGGIKSRPAACRVDRQAVSPLVGPMLCAKVTFLPTASIRL